MSCQKGLGENSAKTTPGNLDFQQIPNYTHLFFPLFIIGKDFLLDSKKLSSDFYVVYRGTHGRLCSR